MKVVVLTTSYPRSPDDVAGVFVRDAVEHLRDVGIEVDVVSPASFRHYGLAYGHGIVGNLKRRPWKAVRSAAGLKDFRWHDLRHSCASYLAQNGSGLLEIGNVLGHKSPSVTARYSPLVEGAPLPAHAGLDKKLRS